MSTLNSLWRIGDYITFHGFTDPSRAHMLYRRRINAVSYHGLSPKVTMGRSYVYRVPLERIVLLERNQIVIWTTFKGVQHALAIRSLSLSLTNALKSAT